MAYPSPRQLQLRRGNTATISAYTGPLGEVIINTDNWGLYIQDGVTQGGHLVSGGSGNVVITGTNYSNVNVHTYLGAFDGNIVPSANTTYSLGSITNQWKSLYVSNNTIYINGLALTVDGSGNLSINGNAISTVAYVNSQTSNINLSNYALNANVTAANVGLKGYVDQANTIQSAQISAANIGIKGYIDQGNSIQSAQLTSSNIGMKGYVDTTIRANIAQYGNLQVTNLDQLSFGPGESNSFLYIKNDGSETRLANDAGNVRISSGGGLSIYYWNFDNNGVLNLPNGGKLGGVQWSTGTDLYADGTMGYSQVNYDNRNYIYVDTDVSQLQTSNVNIIADTTHKRAVIDVGDPDTSISGVWSFYANSVMQVPGSINFPAGTVAQEVNPLNFDITSPYQTTLRTSGGTQQFTFGYDGGLTVPLVVRTNLINSTGSNQRVVVDPDNTNLSYVRVDGFDGGAERLVISNQLTSSLGIYFYTEGAQTFRMYQNQFGFPDSTWQTTAYNESAVRTLLAQHTDQTFGGNVTIQGNLIINGNTSYVNTNNLVINDNIINLADTNPADSLDVGFVAHRTPSGQPLQHTGLIRDASANNWKLFSNVTANPGATVDFTYAVYDDLIVGNISSPTIDTLTLANTIQSQQLASANIGIKGYIDQANTIQSQQIAAANVGIIGYIDQGNSIQATAITNANLGMKGYVDNAVSTANVGIIGYIDQGNTIQAAAITAANVGMKGYVDQANTSLKAYVDGQISAANTNVGGGSTYSNVNVAAYLSGTSAVFVGNTTPYLHQANTSQLFVGNLTSLLSGYSTLSTYSALHNNIYYDASGTGRYRANSATGAASLNFAGTVGFIFGGVNGAVTANAAISTTAWATISSAGLSTSNSLGITAAGALTTTLGTLNSGAATFLLANTIATTINMGGAATTINMGAFGGNVFLGGAIGQPNKELILRALGTWNTATNLNSNGGFNSPPYANQPVIGGSGTGMTANYSSTGGYLSTLTIYNPGTGYQNGDVISVPGGIAGNSFVLQNYNSSTRTGTSAATYTFGIEGNVIIPGNVTAQNFIGSGALLTSLPGYAYSNVNVAAYVTTNGLTNYSNVNVIAYLAGNVTTGNIIATASGQFKGVFDENSTSSGLFVGNAGTGTPTPRVGFFNGVASQNWQIDNNMGSFRWFTPGVTRMSIDTGGNLSVPSGNIVSLGNITTSGYFIGNGSQLTGLPATYSNVQVAAYLNTQGYNLYSNVNVAAYLSTQGITAYSNVQVATYLPTYTGNIANIRLGVSGVLTFPDGTTQTTAATGGGGSSYGNGNVASYLITNGYVNTNSAYGNANTASYLITNGYVNTNSAYANANVTSYLPTHTGNVGVNNIIGTTPNIQLVAGSYTTTYDTYGNVALGNAAYPVQMYATGNISTSGYLFGNGAFLTGIVASGSSYSNVQVATYLPTYTGNIANIRLGVSGVLTFADGTTMTTASVGGGSNYGNGNVASYLITNGYVNTNSAYSNVNVAVYAQTQGYTNYSNVNVAAFTSGLTNYSNVNTAAYTQTMGFTNYSNVNVAAFTSGLTNYSNVNTAAYLSTATINTTGNITAQYVTGNISITGNVTGILPNVTITAGAYVSTFDNQGNVTVPKLFTAGNIQTAGYLFGNGAFLTGVVTGASYSNVQVATYLASTQTVIANIKLNPSGNIIFADGTTQTTAAVNNNFGNVNVTAYTQTMGFTNYSNVNVAAFTSGLTNYSNINTAAYLAGNITTGNITTAGNVTAQNFIGNISFTGTSANVTLQAGTYTWTFDNTANITLPNVTNPYLIGSIGVTGNVTATRFIGDGSLLTGIAGGSGTYSNVNVIAYTQTMGFTNYSNVNVAAFTSGLTNYSNVNAAAYTQTMGFTNYSNVNVAAYTSGLTNYSNVNTAAYLATATITTTGNITAQNFFGNINFTGNVTGTSANVTLVAGAYSSVFDNQGNVRLPNVYVSGNVVAGYFVGNGAFLTGLATYSNVQVATYLPTYTGNIGGNLVNASGNVYLAGNIIVGPSGYTVLPTTVAQFTGNANTYVQLNVENLSTGPAATSEYVATANNGTDTTFFVDMGIANSNYDVNSPNNSLGTTIYPNDSYLYAQGNLATTTGGNLAIGTSTPNKSVKIFAGGINSANIVATVSNTGVAVTGNISATGNVTAPTLVGNSVGTTATYAGNVTVNGSAGIIIPNRPAFRIYGSGVTANQSTSNVNLKGSVLTVDYNQGNYFNSTTGQFVVPVAGLYAVHLVARVGNNNGLNQIAILKNGLNSAGNVMCFWETDTNVGVASHFGTSSVVKLAVGDYLAANIIAGQIQFDNNDSWSVTYLG